jgi:hypothetical protein
VVRSAYTNQACEHSLGNYFPGMALVVTQSAGGGCSGFAGDHMPVHSNLFPFPRQHSPNIEWPLLPDPGQLPGGMANRQPECRPLPYLYLPGDWHTACTGNSLPKRCAMTSFVALAYRSPHRTVFPPHPGQSLMTAAPNLCYTAYRSLSRC